MLQGWHELPDKHLRYVYQLLADDFATDEMLDQLGATLYGKPMSFKPYERISIFYWFAALKDTFSCKPPEFFVRVAPEAPYGDDFQPISAATGGNLLGSSTPSVEDVMNAQIRPSPKAASPKRKKSSRSIPTAHLLS